MEIPRPDRADAALSGAGDSKGAPRQRQKGRARAPPSHTIFPCAYSPSNPPAMKAPPRCWTSAPGCCRTSSTARSSCTAPTAGWCRSSPRAITCGGCCRWCAARSSGPLPRRGELAGVAYTAGPGLIGALLTGAALARSLAYAWGVPAIGVHHLEGHLLAPLLESEPPPFPHVALLVSGGHTLLVEVARRRRLPRPRAAPATMPPAKPSTRRRSCWDCRIRAVRSSPSSPAHGRPGVFTFPRPMLDRPGLEFSFSGLKTAVLHALRGRDAHASSCARTWRTPCRRRSSRRSSPRRCGRSTTPGSRRWW